LTVRRALDNQKNMGFEAQLKAIASATDKNIEALELKVKELERKLSEVQD